MGDLSRNKYRDKKKRKTLKKSQILTLKFAQKNKTQKPGYLKLSRA